jgi:tetratricopeptide (TPR) repeat protein
MLYFSFVSFVSRLILLNISFVIQLLFSKISHLRVILLTLILILSQSYFFINSKLDFSLNSSQDTIPLQNNQSIKINPIRAQNFQIDASEQQIEEQLKHYLLDLKKQPTHRDILINIALLYQQQNNQVEAEKYYYQAFSLDPNSFLFQTN